MNTLLIVNPGSASKKCALYVRGTCVLSAHFEREEGALIATFTVDGTHEKRPLSQEAYEQDTSTVLSEARSRGLLAPGEEIAGVALRIVAPGAFFRSHHVVDDVFVEKLKEAKEFAPLHVSVSLAEIERLRAAHVVPIIAISDSAFHAHMPEMAREYALPFDLAERYGIERFGYHGISYASIVRVLRTQVPDASRVIACHLGGGASVAALHDGASIDTSMGFTPLEGLVMATRSGDVDAGAILYLAKREGMNLDALEVFLNQRCGLVGIAGEADTRALFAAENMGDARATSALDLAAYRIRKYIGAYYVALGGLDTLVFSATIGERSAPMRERICRDLDVLGVVLDPEKNNAVLESAACISADSSRVRVWVIPTDELGQMYEEAASMLPRSSQ